MTPAPKNIAGNLTYTALTALEYWADIEKRVDATQSGERIAMMVMDFDPTNPLIRRVFNKLLLAAQRGVAVWLSVDAHTFLFDAHKLSTYWLTNNLQHLSPQLTTKKKLLDQLNSLPSGHTAIINQPRRLLSNPVAGRSHIKVTVINDRVYIGGCNMQHPDWIDLMINWQEHHLADTLFELVQHTVEQQHTPTVLMGEDKILTCKDRSKVYIDAGKPNQSIILHQALAMIDAAQESIVMTCQFFPNSVTAKHLAAAYRRGVHIELLYAHPSMQGFIGGLGQQVNILIERMRTPASLFRDQLPASQGIHAKLIATEKGAIVGSHNYVQAGVKLGTAEIALVCQDPHFSQAAVAALRRQLSA
jgi:cardiolipin synthase A/B